MLVCYLKMVNGEVCLKGAQSSMNSQSVVNAVVMTQAYQQSSPDFFICSFYKIKTEFYRCISKLTCANNCIILEPIQYSSIFSKAASATFWRLLHISMQFNLWKKHSLTYQRRTVPKLLKKRSKIKILVLHGSNM